MLSICSRCLGSFSIPDEAEGRLYCPGCHEEFPTATFFKNQKPPFEPAVKNFLVNLIRSIAIKTRDSGKELHTDLIDFVKKANADCPERD